MEALELGTVHADDSLACSRSFTWCCALHASRFRHLTIIKATDIIISMCHDLVMPSICCMLPACSSSDSQPKNAAKNPTNPKPRKESCNRRLHWLHKVGLIGGQGIG